MDRFTEEGPGDLARNARRSRDGREYDAETAAERAMLGGMVYAMRKLDAIFASAAEARTSKALRGYLEGGK